MSMKEEKGKASSVSFSDQISSRLHRWVQRTTSKVRNEKERSVQSEENEHVQEMDIKKCTPRENFAKNSRESRSYDELEKALKDLINNCVSSSLVIQDSSNAAQDIARENNNNSECSPTNKTNNDIGFNDHLEARKNSNDGVDIVSSSGSEVDNNSSSSLPRCEDKQTDLTLDEAVKESSTISDVRLVPGQENERYKDEFNNSAECGETCGVSTSLSNVNKGLTDSQVQENSAKQMKKKPPLRRIQSEGDALEFRFKDSDVTEFAATCIRHAQTKRFSDITPIRESDFLTAANDIADVLAPNVKESEAVFQHIPDTQFNESDGSNTIQKEHIPLSDRPSSISFPLDTPKRTKNKNKSSSLKNMLPKNSPSGTPRLTPSPKFRKFPCQPVFYVPMESRTGAKSSRSGSVGEQSKVEYLI